MIANRQTEVEEAREIVLSVFGYDSPEDLNCANVSTALTEVYDDDFYSEPIRFIEGFIANCSPEKFQEIRNKYLGWS